MAATARRSAIVFALIGACAATPALSGQWVQKIGGSNDDYAHAMSRTTDGSYLLVGEANGYPAAPQAWLAKLEATGRVAWQRTLENPAWAGLRAVDATRDGGGVFAGMSCDASSCGPFVMKLDAAGGLAWTKRNAGSNAELRAVRSTIDGGIIVSGTNFDPQPRGWLLKFDGNGSLQWQKAVGNAQAVPADIRFRAVEQAIDGSYLAGGTYRDDSAPRDLALLVKVDPAGNVVWARTFGTFGSSFVASIRLVADGTFLVAGTLETPLASGAWTARVDTDGIVLWEKVYGGPGDAGYAIGPTSDGGAVLTGRRVMLNPGTGTAQWDMWAVRIDGAGSIAWERTYGGLLDDVANAVQVEPDGSYVLAGTSRSFDGFDIDAFVVRAAADGDIANCVLVHSPQSTVTTLTDAPDARSMASVATSALFAEAGATVQPASLPTSMQCLDLATVAEEVPAVALPAVALLAIGIAVIGANRLARRAN
jgi:hypothetical protein